MARKTGTSANNTLVGTESADFLFGLGGNDILRGFNGNDFLDGGAGRDSMRGGAGNDTYIVSQSNDEVIELAGQGTDLVKSTASFALSNEVENLTLLGSAHLSATGNNLNNLIIGNSGNNVLHPGNAGLDVLAGGAGNDTYHVHRAGVTVSELPGQGTDTVLTVLTTFSLALLTNVENLTGLSSVGLALTGNALNNTISGNSGDDTLIGGIGSDALFGGGGADTASYAVATTGVGVDLASNHGNLGDANGDTFSSIENIIGSNFADQLFGNADANLIQGLDGSDIIGGHGGSDTIEGGNGDDALYGDAGADLLDGGAGDDTLEGGAGADAHDGGKGIDTVSYALSGGGVGMDLANNLGNVGDAIGDTFISVENIVGSNFGDQLFGNNGANRIEGRDGGDIIGGLAGNDTIVGGIGADQLFGDNGNDELNPGADSDADVISGGAGIDTVDYSDFVNGITINLATGTTIGTGGDTLSGVENIIGTSANDDLRAGSDGYAFGGAGDDTLRGNSTGGGNSGYSVLRGGEGSDTLINGDNPTAYQLELGKGADTIVLFLDGFDLLRVDHEEFGLSIVGSPMIGAGVSLVEQASGAPTSIGTDGQFIFVDSTDQLFFDQDGSGATFSPVLVAIVPASMASFGGEDFWLV